MYSLSEHHFLFSVIRHQTGRKSREHAYCSMWVIMATPNLSPSGVLALSPTKSFKLFFSPFDYLRFNAMLLVFSSLDNFFLVQTPQSCLRTHLIFLAATLKESNLWNTSLIWKKFLTKLQIMQFKLISSSLISSISLSFS